MTILYVITIIFALKPKNMFEAKSGANRPLRCSSSFSIIPLHEYSYKSKHSPLKV